MRMVAFASAVIICIIVLLAGPVFRKQYKQNPATKCLMMLVNMTLSLIVGILVATWLPNMVLSTIVAIFVSLALTVYLTYKLPFVLFIESAGALLMGAMMGAMLSIMTTSYANVSIIFFTVIFIVSTYVAIGFWNKEQYPVFSKAIPPSIHGMAIVAIICLAMTSFAAPTLDGEPAEESHHTHH